MTTKITESSGASFSLDHALLAELVTDCLRTPKTRLKEGPWEHRVKLLSILRAQAKEAELSQWKMVTYGLPRHRLTLRTLLRNGCPEGGRHSGSPWEEPFSGDMEVTCTAKHSPLRQRYLSPAIVCLWCFPDLPGNEDFLSVFITLRVTPELYNEVQLSYAVHRGDVKRGKEDKILPFRKQIHQ
ncbi:hypothetical protein Q9233_005086 [Columba guinea]|nr:hypothetical protein Q9233_005086 [Columba guinea]